VFKNPLSFHSIRITRNKLTCNGLS
jgi:hypothetical protein